jgi:hypothetical protein
LIETNFADTRVLVDIYGWKHGPPTRHPNPNPASWFPEWKPDFLPVTRAEWDDIQESDVGHVCIVKDPIAWIDSMARYAKVEVSKFEPHDLANLCQQWNAITHSYLDHQANGEDTVILRYEDLLLEDDLDHSMKTLMEYFDLVPTNAPEQSGWTNTHARFERGNDLQTAEECKLTDTVLNKYYLDEKYMRHFTPEHVAIIDATLSLELRKRFSYGV